MNFRSAWIPGLSWILVAGALVAQASADGDPVDVEALIVQAEAQILLEDGPEALEIAERAQAGLRTRPDSGLELRLAAVRVSAYGLLGRFEQALEVGRRAEALARAADETEALARILTALGYVHLNQGDFAGALEYFAESRPLLEEAGDPASLGLLFNDAAIAHGEMAEYPQAMEFFLAARKAHEEAGDLYNMGIASLNVGRVYLTLGQRARARELMGEALAMGEKIDNPLLRGLALQGLGRVELAAGNPEKARDHFEQALVLEASTQPIAVAELQSLLGRAEADLGNLDRALESHRQVLTLAEQIGDQRLQVEAWGEIARILGRQGKSREAITLLEQTAATAREMEGRHALPDLLDQLVDRYAELGRYQDAFRTQKESEDLRREAFSAQHSRNLAEMQARFEAEKSQQELVLLRAETELQEVELERQAAVRRALVGGFVLLLTILGLLFNRYRLKTQERRMQERLDQEREVSAHLRDVDALKDQFLANTSHELRTPLFGIIGLAEAMHDSLEDEGVESVPPKERLGRQLNTIIASGHRLHRLVGDILDFYKIRQGDLTLNRGPVDLHELVETVLRLLHPLAEGKGLTLENAVPSDLPSVDADEHRLEQVLLNLVGNGIKFTDQGEVGVGAECLTAPQDGWVRVWVRDTGIGVASEHRDRIFRAFEQLDDSAERTHGGTGLGLAVSRRLVELHGSELEVSSKSRQGALFTFSLPLSFAELGEDPSVAVLTQETPPGTPTLDLPVPDPDAPKILVVDDEPVNRMVLSQALLSAGYRVAEATDGPQALERVEADVRAVLLDVMMPKMSGFEVCRRLRQRFPMSRLPIIFVTSRDSPEDLAEGFGAGGTDYLTKPVGREALLGRLRAHLNRVSES